MKHTAKSTCHHLRYALASVIRYLAPEFVDARSERFDNRIRKKLFDLLLNWSDESGSSWGQEGGTDYRRELERYKATQHNRSRESLDKLAFDREMAEQLEAINWASMHAIASLLYGPCFDDNARKMSGRVILWINSFVRGTSSESTFWAFTSRPSNTIIFKAYRWRTLWWKGQTKG